MAISYLPLDGFIDCCLFFSSLIFFFLPTSFYRRILKACRADIAHTLHYFLPGDDYGYWHCHVFPLRYQLSLLTAARSRKLEYKFGVCVCPGCGGSEHYHGRLMGVNYTGVVRARLRAANVDHSTLCHVDDGGDRRGPESVSIPLWTDSISFSVIGSSRGIQQICHTQTRKGGDRVGETS